MGLRESGQRLQADTATPARHSHRQVASEQVKESRQVTESKGKSVSKSGVKQPKVIDVDVSSRQWDETLGSEQLVISSKQPTMQHMRTMNPKAQGLVPKIEKKNTDVGNKRAAMGEVEEELSSRQQSVNTYDDDEFEELSKSHYSASKKSSKNRNKAMVSDSYSMNFDESLAESKPKVTKFKTPLDSSDGNKI